LWIVRTVQQLELDVKMNHQPLEAKYHDTMCDYIVSGFVQVLENLESPGILLWHFPGLESPGKGLLVLESSGNLLNSRKKKNEMYGRQ